MQMLTHSEDNVHKYFGPKFSGFYFSCDLENKVKVPKSLSDFCHVHILDLCEFWQNQLTQSEDNVHLRIICHKFCSFLM